MDRRNILSWFVTTLAAFFVPRKPVQEIPHYFDWTLTHKEPFSSDPKYAGKLEVGPQNIVIVDDVKQGPNVVRFVTGRDGWVETVDLSRLIAVHRMTGEKRVVENANDFDCGWDIDRERFTVRGDVRFRVET